MHHHPLKAGGGTLRRLALAWILAIVAVLACLPASAQTSNSDFNHDTTLFPLRGAHETVRCETCHVNGVFKGSPTACNLCHVQGTRTTALPMPDNHIPLTAGQDCDLCHTTSSFSGVKFSHVTVSPGSCSTCHNNYYATGKNAGHPVTTLSCDACHSIASFNNVALPANHLNVGQAAGQCGACHTTSTAAGIDYTQVDLTPTHALTSGESCVTCHSAAAIAASRSAINPALTPKLSTAVNHIPVGSLDCASSGCHQAYASNPRFMIGAASLTAPTLNVAGHATVAAAGQGSCTTCHEAGTSYAGMLTSTASMSDVRPTYDSAHPASGDCGTCHTTTPTFFSDITTQPPGHVPTGSFARNCAACHTTGVYTAFDTVATHQVTGVACQACHNSTTAAAAINQRVPIKLEVANHIPVGSADCASSGCHQNYSASVTNFVVGAGQAGNLTAPTLSVSGHATVASAGQTSCSTCHAAGTGYAGMQSSTTVLSDVWPGAYDTLHPPTSAGDCGTCHTTAPTFAKNANVLPATHIPTGSFGSNCAACHTTPGSYTAFDLVKTHQATGVTCLSCHNSTTAALADAQIQPIKLTTNAPRPHIAIGALNCASSGCHGNYTAAVTSFVIGAGDAGSLTAPTLNVAGHTSIASTGQTGCVTCHGAGANFSGMQTSATVTSDLFPSFDTLHAANTGECSTCHTTAPTFTLNVNRVPTRHVPTGTAGSTCGTCHAGTDYGVANLVATHSADKALACTTCHSATGVAAYLYSTAQTPKLLTSVNHIPVGSLDCASSGCHGQYSASATTFAIGVGSAGSLTSPTLNVAGHSTVASVTASCSTCHAAGTSYIGMQTSATVTSDLFPSFDTLHASYTGDCGTCHTTTPTFTLNVNRLPTGHVPTGTVGTACASCHSGGTYTTALLVPSHAAVSTLACTTCHSSTGISTYLFSSTQVPKLSSAVNHIPTGTLDCASSGCHGAYSATATTFTIGAGSSGNLTSPTLNVTGHTTVASAAGGQNTCSTCHAAGTSYAGMQTSTTALSDVWPGGTGNYDPYHPATSAGDCSVCHSTTPTFASSVNAVPSTHIPTGSFGGNCAACHTTSGNYAVFDLVKTHTATGVTCLSCHNSTTAALADAQARPIKLLTSSTRTHIPVGSLNCSSSGCHGNYTAAVTSFVIGAGDAGSLSGPTLSVAGHTSVAAATPSCSTCHASGSNYSGMLSSTSSVSDVWPGGFDTFHPATTAGDCSACHTTTPTFSSNINSVPSSHIPTGSIGTACATCHTTAGNYTVFNLVKTHTTGLSCVSCHNGTTAALADAQAQAIKLTTNAPRTHIPVGSVDCAASGCHSNYTAAGNTFVIGAGDTGSLTGPTLNVAGHTAIATATPLCSTCHAAGTNYSGMQSSSGTTSDVWPGGFDTFHPATTAGDCKVCHTTTPTFSSNLSAVPSSHIPTGSFGTSCASCHTTAGNYAVFDLVKTHTATGVGCVSCHNATTAALTDAQAAPIKLETAVNHIPVGSVECNSSGCHGNYVAAGNTFAIGAGSAGNPSSPTLTVAGHATVATAGVTTCATCHGAGTTYAGMVVSTTTALTDVVPGPSVDAYHANYAGDCQTCHTTAPLFSGNVIALPTGHMPTGTAGVSCATCHTTAGVYSAANLVATHATGLSCVSCHATGAGPFINAGTAIKMSTAAPAHVPYGSMDCISCHTAYPSTGAASFVIGVGAAGSISAPTMNVTAHAAASAAGLSTCTTCHTNLSSGGTLYTGMVSSASSAGDTFPTFDNQHTGYTADCSNCHSTTPTFSTNNGGSTAKPPAHIPTGSAPSCSTCHTGANYTVAPNITAVHSSTGLACNQCHNATVESALHTASPSIGTVLQYDGSTGITHIPFGSLDCVSCHGAYNGTAAVNSGSWKFTSGGTAGNINTPSLTVALHTTVAAQVPTCGTCHTSSVSGGTVYTGMVASTNTVVGDQFPNATLDAAHQSYTGDCGSCHTTAPTFHGNGNALPTGHIPITGASGCTACHTTSGVYTSHSTAAVHTSTSITTCVTCHNATTAAGVTSAFGSKEPTINTTASVTNHIPIGALDCASSGCHVPYATSAVFTIGAGVAGNINAPTLNVTGHTTVLNQSPTPACTTCHTGTAAAPSGTLYAGMVASTAALAGDTFPPAGLDASHQGYSGDCGTCHTTTPTFSSNHSAGMPSNHIPLSTFPSTPACTSCHLNPATYNVAHMNHSGLTGGCKTCHGVAGTALVFANVTPKAEPSNHIPTTAGSLANACENCHRNALTGNFSTFAGTVMDHTGITSGCASCHAPGSSFYGLTAGGTALVGNAQGTTLITAPNGATDAHQWLATKTCETCHTSTVIPGGFAAGKMVHSVVPPASTPCMYCHEKSSTANPPYNTIQNISGGSISFHRDSATHYFPGGSNGGPDCQTGCHQHSSTDSAVGTGTTAEPGAIISPSTPPTLSAPAVGKAVTRIVTLTNPGGAALTITSAAITGTGFSVTNGCGTSLASGGSCTLTIQYLPTAAGSVSGTLTVTDNAGGTAGKTQTLAVTGVVATTSLTGANTPSGASLTVALFTSTGTGVASALQTVAFKNTGTAAITFTSAAVSGNNAADFTITSTGVTTPCTNGASVAASATCNIGMIFKPSATTAGTAEETAVLTVTTTGLPSTYTASLVGTISATNGNYAYAAKMAPHTARSGQNVPAVPGHVATAGAGGGAKAQSILTPGGVAASLASGKGAPAAAAVPAGPAGLARPGSSSPAAAPLSSAVAAALGLQNGKLPPVAATANAATTPAGGAFNHGGVVPGQCANCHNGRNAPGLPGRHMLTTRSCDQCHNTVAWIPVNHQHVSPKYPQHAGNIACSACHTTNTEMVVPRFPQYGLNCAACHASQFVPQQHRHAENPRTFYSVMDLKDCSGACHVSLGGRISNLPAQIGVHRSTAGQF